MKTSDREFWIIFVFLGVIPGVALFLFMFLGAWRDSWRKLRSPRSINSPTLEDYAVLIPKLIFWAIVGFLMVRWILLPIVIIVIALLGAGISLILPSSSFPEGSWEMNFPTAAWISIVITALMIGGGWKSSVEEQVSKRRRMRYKNYLESPEWQGVRMQALEYAGGRCQLCNSSDHLNVHHRTYERLGEEQESDVTVLCKSCHELFHEVRGMPDQA